MKTYTQETSYSCGASAIMNCLQALGGNVPSEKYIRRIAGTNIEGTDSKGILKAFAKLNYFCSEFRTENETTFKNKLLKVLRNGSVAITLTDNEEHWISVTGYKNRKVVFVDSDFKKAKQEFAVKDFVMICRNIKKINKKQFWYLIIIDNLLES